jgi:hypothetical protein
VTGISRIPNVLTALQREVFDRLLSVGGDRPVTPPGLPALLAERVESGCAAALERWPENRLWLTKSHFSSVEQCEGTLVARAEARADTMSSPVAVGVVAHRAIQIAHTHPDLPPAAAVDAAIEASKDDQKFAEWWELLSVGTQSDLLCQMISRAVGFLDSFPPLPPNWVPRFEESVQARVGKLTLSARPDLLLGRPRPDMRQTMFICDFKTGSIGDHHFDEAMFYALVATLRFGTAPFRSTVFSVASGDWTDADVTAERLIEAADRVVSGVARYVDVMAGRRDPELTPGRWCNWCPAKSSCASADPEAVSTPRSAEASRATTRVVSLPSPSEQLLPAHAQAAASIFDID